MIRTMAATMMAIGAACLAPSIVSGPTQALAAELVAVNPAGQLDAADSNAGRRSLPGRTLKLAASKSTILEFDEEIRDVLVSNPSVADAVVRSNKRLYLIGNHFGSTNVFVFGANGRQIANYEILVQPDTATLEALLKRLLPGINLQVEAVAGTVVLSGTVSSAAESMQAFEVAQRFVGAPASAGSSGGGGAAAAPAAGGAASQSGDSVQVVNALKIKGKDQVMLKVTIAEIQRSAVKSLGIDLSVALSGGNLAANVLTANPLTSTPALSTGFGHESLSYDNGSTHVGATIRALEQNGVLRTLAEPNLSAISGEQASFLAGGEIPIPVAQDNGKITLEFKKFGISLGFVPVVLSEGRISLNVNTEVSEPSSDGAYVNGSLNIQALRVRRASTTVEMPSGGTMVLAGLIKDDVRQNLTGTPGLMNMPILGTLFRSREFQRSQSELAIFVQPIIVEPVAAGKLVRPDQNFAPASDAAANFMGRVNRMYRANGGREPLGTYHGQFGFIYE